MTDMTTDGPVVMALLGHQRSTSLAQLAAAKAKAQAKFLPLGKDKTAKVSSSRTGTSYSYSYADLSACLESVIPALSEVGIAVFQPTRIEAGQAITTTLLVHGESGEWISADYAAPVVDGTDARSVGSAATYARRYGLLAMLAIASSEEDDDGEQARGGAHEMASPSAKVVCPACGKDTIIQGKPEYGGGWVCYKKIGGCGAKYADKPDAQANDLMPKKIDKETGEVVEVNLPEFPVTFEWNKVIHLTKGLTKEQFVTTVELVPKVDKAHGKGYARNLLRTMFDVDTRHALTEAQGAAYIQALEGALR